MVRIVPTYSTPMTGAIPGTISSLGLHSATTTKTPTTTAIDPLRKADWNDSWNATRLSPTDAAHHESGTRTPDLPAVAPSTRIDPAIIVAMTTHSDPYTIDDLEDNSPQRRAAND